MSYVDPVATTTREPGETTGRRRYRSRLREQRTAETRKVVTDAARELFIVRGWAGTGMREIAATAGVALETVYSHFSSKRGVLHAVIDTTAVGDDAPLALADRPEFAVMGEGRRSARIRAAAALVTSVHARTAAVARLLRQAAPGDEEIGEMLQSTRERQRLDVATAFELMIGRAPTGPERDGVWAIVSPEVYLLLVEHSAWTAEQYEAWIAETLDRALPRS